MRQTVNFSSDKVGRRRRPERCILSRNKLYITTRTQAAIPFLTYYTRLPTRPRRRMTTCIILHISLHSMTPPRCITHQDARHLSRRRTAINSRHTKPLAKNHSCSDQMTPNVNCNTLTNHNVGNGLPRLSM